MIIIDTTTRARELPLKRQPCSLVYGLTMTNSPQIYILYMHDESVYLFIFLIIIKRCYYPLFYRYCILLVLMITTVKSLKKRTPSVQKNSVRLNEGQYCIYKDNPIINLHSIAVLSYVSYLSKSALVIGVLLVI